MWAIIAAFFLIAIFVVHVRWAKKFSRAIDLRDKELAQIRQREGAAFRKAEDQQRALLNSMIEGLLLLDNDGRIQLANRALENLFGVTAGIYGKTIIEAFRNHQLAELANRLQREREILEFEIQLSELRPRWFQVNASAITDNDGKQIGMIFVFHDLTRLKQLENTRQEFVANVSHELRTPLSMIKGYVETLMGGAKDDPAVAGKFLQTIERHTNRLTFLIEDLLTISELESGRIVLNYEEVELRSAVQKIIQDLQERAEERGVKLENQIPCDLKTKADSGRVDQVFWNLIDNAIKYGSRAVVVCGQEIGDTGIKISVADDGDGIPPEAKERIFERFYRMDKARSRETGGTGLGLAIVKHIVQAHHGKIWIESQIGEGTTFHFTLPGIMGTDPNPPSE